MRRSILFLFLIMLAAAACSQKSVDRIFEKYSGKDGFTSFTISGDILKIFRCVDNEDRKNCFPSKIDEIRILARDDEEAGSVNFYKELMKDIDREDYEEFMSVREYHKDMVMYVRSEGRKFREFLLVAGGDDDNVIIQIKGDMTFSEADRFSRELKKNGCSNIVSMTN